MSSASVPRGPVPAPLVKKDFFEDREMRANLGVLVLAKGVYDLMHLGHVRSLWDARSLGDSLVVALASDKSVKARKGPARPVLSFEERSGIIRSLRMVDYLIEYNDVSPFDIIRTVRPDVLCVTHTRQLSESDVAALGEIGVEIRLLPRPQERSTTEIIERIIRESGLER